MVREENNSRLVLVVLAALLVAALGVIGFGVYSNTLNKTADPRFLGTWVGSAGNSLTFDSGGIAVGHGSSGATSPRYRWSGSGNVLSFDPIRSESGTKRFVRNVAEMVWPDNRLDYQIIEVSEHPLLLLDP